MVKLSRVARVREADVRFPSWDISVSPTHLAIEAQSVQAALIQVEGAQEDPVREPPRDAADQYLSRPDA
jgi:hypothetical protein